MKNLNVNVVVNNVDILPALLSRSRAERLELAQQLWPTDVNEGELFTIVRHLHQGQPSNDGSWVGDTLRADQVVGPYIVCSKLNTYKGRYEPMGSWKAMVGVNCEVRVLSRALTQNERNALYRNAKNGY